LRFASKMGGAPTISHGFLWSVDPDNTADQLTYTIVDRSAHGLILENGVAAASFTRADIDNGLLAIDLYRAIIHGASVGLLSSAFILRREASNAEAKFVEMIPENRFPGWIRPAIGP
jgi:predicted patatin/cPLA2 family phospholipase